MLWCATGSVRQVMGHTWHFHTANTCIDMPRGKEFHILALSFRNHDALTFSLDFESEMEQITFLCYGANATSLILYKMSAASTAIF